MKQCHYTLLEDIDECSDGLDDCDVDADCTNNEGSYICVCKDGYMGDGETCKGLVVTGCIIFLSLSF